MDLLFPNCRPQRHSQYYLKFVTFQVENSLFKVPRRYFQTNSGIFSDMLALPSDDCYDLDLEAPDDETPICLSAIKPSDFESLLSVMCPVRKPVTMGRIEWESVLRLSMKWEMEDIRNLALQELANIGMDSVDKIALGITYGVEDWLFTGYRELVERDTTISWEEGDRLGGKTVARLCKLREDVIKANVAAAYDWRDLDDELPANDHEISIRETFEEELEEAGQLVDVTKLPSLHIDDHPPAHAMMSQPIPNEQFYMESVVFLVEDTLFKVPRVCFEQSGIFGTIFTLPATKNMPADGSDDEHPFVLDGYRKFDFEAFLGVLYPPDIPLRTESMDETAWSSVLKLSTMWGFAEIRKLAITVLSDIKMDPIEKVLLARQNRIPEWLLAAYQELVNREMVISLKEAEQLGWDVAIRIFHMRDQAMSTLLQIHELGEIGQSEEDIRREFEEELKAFEET